MKTLKSNLVDLNTGKAWYKGQKLSEKDVKTITDLGFKKKIETVKSSK